MGTGGQAVKILDLDGKVRETRLSDNYDIGRLCDTLDHIHFYMRPVVARDLANEQLDVNQFYACLAATPKHVMANAYLPEKRSEEHTSELQSLMRISYAVFCLKKKNNHNILLTNIRHASHTHHITQE